MVVAFWGMTAIWAQDSTPWYMGTWNRHQPNPKAKDMPLVQIDGNHFVTPDGNTILFRGIAISDPDKVARQGHWNKEHFARVKALGANIVRIPIHPIAWRERTPQAYLEMLGEAVDWLLTALLGTMAMGRGRLAVVGNRIGRTSVISTLADNPRFHHTVVNALDKKGLPSWPQNYTSRGQLSRRKTSVSAKCCTCGNTAALFVIPTLRSNHRRRPITRRRC